MSQRIRPMIVGAGPVGLAAALFLANRGISARVVEMADQLSRYSKALAVNPRTLEILQSSGLTERILRVGGRMRGAQMWRKGKRVAHVQFAGLKHKYPLMVTLSQATTERLLAEALEAAGGKVERGIRLVDCRNVSDGVEAVLEHTEGGARQTVKCPWLLAADGAHSTARRQLKIDFTGSTFKNQWHLTDVPLSTSLDHDSGHLFFQDDGELLVMIPMIEDATVPATGDRLWRLVGTAPNLVERLVQARVSGPAVWTSSFTVAHRINRRMMAGNVYFAGDSAHIHSPIGARGMNLGIEDAWVFAQLVAKNRMDEYHDLRWRIDRRVVKQIALLSGVMSGTPSVLRLVRRVMPMMLSFRPLRSFMLAAVTGTDHSLGEFSANNPVI